MKYPKSYWIIWWKNWIKGVVNDYRCCGLVSDYCWQQNNRTSVTTRVRLVSRCMSYLLSVLSLFTRLTEADLTKSLVVTRVTQRLICRLQQFSSLSNLGVGLTQCNFQPWLKFLVNAGQAVFIFPHSLGVMVCTCHSNHTTTIGPADTRLINWLIDSYWLKSRAPANTREREKKQDT